MILMHHLLGHTNQYFPPSVLEYSCNVVEDAHVPRIKDVCTVVLFDLILNVPSTIFQL